MIKARRGLTSNDDANAAVADELLGSLQPTKNVPILRRQNDPVPGEGEAEVTQIDRLHHRFGGAGLAATSEKSSAGERRSDMTHKKYSRDKIAKALFLTVILKRVNKNKKRKAAGHKGRSFYRIAIIISNRERMEGLQQPSRVPAEGELKNESLDILKQRFTAAISQPTSEGRAASLEDLISACAEPLQTGESLSPEYQAFLLNLTRMHMLEEAQCKLNRLLQPMR